MLEQSGEDPIGAYRAAIGHMRIAVERAPQAPFLRLNLANALGILAYALAQRGQPDVELTRQAIAQLQEVVAAQPGRADAWHSLANSHWDLAMARSWRGEDAQASIAEADRLFDHAATLAPTQLAIPFNHYNLSLFAAAEALRDEQPAQHWLARAEALAAAIDARTQQDWISPCPRAEYALRRLQAATVAGRYEPATHAQAAALLERGLAAQPDSVDCARRRIELAAIALPFLDARRRQREREAAAALQARHPRSLEIHLAWAGVLAARAPVDPADAAALDAQIAALERDTGGNWIGRLRPLHARLAALAGEGRLPDAAGTGLIAEERAGRSAARPDH
ncbi:MAG TPA: hypothetical protein VMR06_08685 [Dokdonella sp.]|uniref:hypothetical protein n=1 Tax=Dokdonella sp. TaxID=2291710 RepID=UPI002BA1757B|nr:hypothetical protein [Dokdonella sp.]HUD42057.1 hypothetical protein [Dokdonella sp.]